MSTVGCDRFLHMNPVQGTDSVVRRRQRRGCAPPFNPKVPGSRPGRPTATDQVSGRWRRVAPRQWGRSPEERLQPVLVGVAVCGPLGARPPEQRDGGNGPGGDEDQPDEQPHPWVHPAGKAMRWMRQRRIRHPPGSRSESGHPRPDGEQTSGEPDHDDDALPETGLTHATVLHRPAVAHPPIGARHPAPWAHRPYDQAHGDRRRCPYARSSGGIPSPSPSPDGVMGSTSRSTGRPPAPSSTGTTPTIGCSLPAGYPPLDLGHPRPTPSRRSGTGTGGRRRPRLHMGAGRPHDRSAALVAPRRRRCARGPPPRLGLRPPGGVECLRVPAVEDSGTGTGAACR